MNKLLKWSNYFSDHNIFIASWLQNLEIYQTEKPSNIILNGADRDIFKSYSDIIIKDYSLPVDTQLCPEKNDFEAFINKTSGHTIINTGNDKPGENYGHINLIYITSQGSFNDKTGTYEINEYGNADNLTNLSYNLNHTSEIYKN